MGAPVAPSDLVGDVVLTQEAIEARVSELGALITNDYRDRDLRLVTILKGGLFFLADLSRHVDLPTHLDFMAVSSYSGGTPGHVRITKDLDDSVEGAHILIVEDIIDTGLTLNYIMRNLRSRGPASLEVCALIDKDVRRIADIEIAYTGFRVPDRFLIGYGLDLRGHYRNLPYVAELREAALV